jgi:hypothetical protein
VTTALALLTAIYLILNTIGATRALLERYVVKLDGQLLAAIVAIMLEVVLIAIYQLGRQVRRVRDTVAGRRRTGSPTTSARSSPPSTRSPSGGGAGNDPWTCSG